jgi:hypothetical protein
MTGAGSTGAGSTGAGSTIGLACPGRCTGGGPSLATAGLAHPSARQTHKTGIERRILEVVSALDDLVQGIGGGGGGES